ncbi:MAG: acyl-CoA dehydrogenase [Porticoccaceae bacterium]|nr:MAG: acyl-CoA dehydrogenase [Porticoccaceae bacterium]
MEDMLDSILSEEDRYFREVVRAWVERECPKAWCRELERREDVFPQDLWDKLVAFGALGIGIPEEFGGQGGSMLNQVIFARELARTAAGLTWVWGVTSFSGAKLLLYAGSPEQKQALLPKIATGTLKTAMAFTEPGGGTDLLGGLRTRAERREGGWLLRGEKIWSTGASVADYLVVLARTDDAVERRTQGISLLLVPRDLPGIEIQPLPKIGMRAYSSCTVRFDDVYLGTDALIGEEGKGWYQSLEMLNYERLINAATCLGILDGVIEDALEYLRTRRAFGKPIGQFQILQHYVADMAMWRAQAELLIFHAAKRQSEGKPIAMEAAMAKIAASEYANRAADLGIQILGGMGYSAETDMQRYWRDSRLLRIGPISNEMGKNLIAEQLGLPRSF